ncbi:hypothetical protein D3C78_1526060 [compost metagenome]
MPDQPPSRGRFGVQFFTEQSHPSGACHANTSGQLPGCTHVWDQPQLRRKAEQEGRGTSGQSDVCRERNTHAGAGCHTVDCSDDRDGQALQVADPRVEVVEHVVVQGFARRLSSLAVGQIVVKLRTGTEGAAGPSHHQRTHRGVGAHLRQCGAGVVG